MLDGLALLDKGFADGVGASVDRGNQLEVRDEGDVRGGDRVVAADGRHETRSPEDERYDAESPEDDSDVGEDDEGG